jgi:hypothetical protein
MLTRKYWSEEELLKMLNEEAEKEESEESDSPSPEDVDLDSLSNEEKINFAKEVLQSIEANEDAQSKIDEIIGMLDEIELNKEEEEEEEE